MAVCRFFQQGSCRYGQNCRYEHVYATKYSYHANQAQPQAAQQSSSPTDENLVNQVQADMRSALLGGQWILSCYSPYKEKPTFPGITDLSPEEARLFIYEAKSKNNLEQAITYMNNLFKETKQKYEQLLQPNLNIIKVLRGLYNGEVLPSPFSSTEQNVFSSGNTAASSIFRSAVQNTMPANTNTASSIFSQGQQSIFNTQPDPAKDLFSRANNTNIFGPSSPPHTFGASNQTGLAKSIFASAVQDPFNTNQANPSSIFASANQSIFGSPPNQNNSVFNQGQNNSPFAQVNSNSPFSQEKSNSPFSQEQSNSPFSKEQSNSPFSKEQSNSPFAPVQNTSLFSQGNVFQTTQTSASIFGQANTQLNVSNDPGVYRKIEELSKVELEAFTSEKFELGFVPELPPPYQLCT